MRKQCSDWFLFSQRKSRFMDVNQNCFHGDPQHMHFESFIAKSYNDDGYSKFVWLKKATKYVKTKGKDG